MAAKQFLRRRMEHQLDVREEETKLENARRKRKGKAMGTGDQIKRLQDLGDMFTRKIELEKREIKELDQEIADKLK